MAMMVGLFWGSILKLEVRYVEAVVPWHGYGDDGGVVFVFFHGGA